MLPGSKFGPADLRRARGLPRACRRGLALKESALELHLCTHSRRALPPVPSRRTGAPYPGFPVRVVGVDELHAAFPNESRTRGCCLAAAYRKPGYLAGFSRDVGYQCPFPLAPDSSHAENNSAIFRRVMARAVMAKSGWLWMMPISIRVRSSSPRTDVLGHSQSSLRDWSRSHFYPGLTSWAILSRPCGTDRDLP